MTALASTPVPGPGVVALGGGHGLAMSLTALVSWAGELTAVVSVADDGGSSGRLRATWDGPAPGDVRRCLLALASQGPEAQQWAAALDYRFGQGELAGHSLGNLVLMALSETTGDFACASAAMARLLGVTARVLPATSGPVTLCARVLGADRSGTEEAVEIAGQERVAHAGGLVQRVWVRPSNGGPHAAAAYPPAVAAVEGAELVVLGPGSLYTSVLAVCAVDEVAQSLAARSAGRVYVCNLSPQEAETEGYDADAHLRALAEHGVVVDTVVCDPTAKCGLPSPESLTWVGPGGRPARLVSEPMARPNGHTHDPDRLGRVLHRVFRLSEL